MEELLSLKQAIMNLDEHEAKQLLLLLFMEENQYHGKLDAAEILEIAQFLIETFKEQVHEFQIKNVHIVFSQATASNLKLAFRHTQYEKTEAIICLSDILSVGPVESMHTLEGIEQRYRWLTENFANDEVEDMKRTIIEAIKDIQAIKGNEKIIIWTGNNVHEQTGLRIVLALLQNKTNIITVINSFESFHQLYRFPQIQEMAFPLLTEDLTAEQLLYIYNRSKHIVLSNDIRVALCEAGFKLLATDHVLRSWVNGEIVYEEETRDDKQLLACITALQQGDKERYVKATRVVREVYEEMEQYTGQAWLEYRLRTLIAKGDLRYKGDLSSPRFYEVNC